MSRTTFAFINECGLCSVQNHDIWCSLGRMHGLSERNIATVYNSEKWPPVWRLFDLTARRLLKSQQNREPTKFVWDQSYSKKRAYLFLSTFLKLIASVILLLFTRHLLLGWTFHRFRATSLLNAFHSIFLKNIGR